DGLLDPTFGSAGITRIDVGNGWTTEAYDLVEQLDGKLVAACQLFGPDTGNDMAIFRVTADGIPDDSFDGDGVVHVNFQDSRAFATSLVVQSNGAIVAAGYTVRLSDDYFRLGLLRVNSDGSLDGTFGSGGNSVIDLGRSAALDAIVVQPDGQLTAVGSLLKPSSGPDLIFARFKTNGDLDRSYGNNGIAIADFGAGRNGPYSYGSDLIQQADGKYLAAASV